MAGVRIKAVPVASADGVRISPSAQITDAGGACRFDATFGETFGDHYVDLVCEEAPEIRKRVRFACGIALANASQEVSAGEILPKPLGVRLTAPDGAPLAGAEVHFTLIRQPGKGGKIGTAFTTTGADGTAATTLKTEPNVTGTYEVSVEANDSKRGLFMRPVFIQAIAICPVKTGLGVLGGLAIFIFGVTLLSDGLQQVAGSKMKAALAYVTRNRVTGILAGAFLAAVAQSSSLTTVMTVGFVNAGLLTLRQAIGVVFGANIGTTMTGQMVSLNLVGLAQPALVLGVTLLVMARKDGALQGIARAVMGFGFLSFGMMLMSGELKAVSDSPGFASFFRSFDCTPLTSGGEMPLGAVLGALAIGTAMTMVVQSSAAMIGLAIALANSGLLNFWTAIPIVLGDNIGTTITALIASINANRTARQTALAHSVFNVLGSAIVIGSLYIRIEGTPCFLYLVDRVTSGNVFIGENVGRHVAMSHSLFNIANVILMTPFIGGLAWICEHLLPGKKVSSRSVHLEMNLLNTPPLALLCAMRALGDMTEMAWNAVAIALRGYKEGKPAKVSAVQEIEDQVDTCQTAIMDYLVQLTRKNLTEKQAAAIPILMHCVNDAERISDLALLVAKRSAGQASRCAQFSPAAQHELEIMFDKAFHIANLTHESLLDGRLLAKAVEVMVNDLKKLVERSMQDHVDRLQKGFCTPERGLIYVEVIGALANIVRHLENIAQRSDALTEAAT
jgi:Na/Pi-cotransporter